MKVSKAIEYLLEEDPNSEIMIQWFTKEHVDEELPRSMPDMSDDVWSLAVDLFDKLQVYSESCVSQDDFGILDCVLDAQAQLEQNPS